MKLLVFRRDNIGDLVVTMPVFTALRQRFPEARIEALVNSYNAPVLDRHPDVDAVHSYTKTKHSASRWEAFTEWAGRLSQLAALRRTRFDYVVIASPGHHPRQIRQARLLRPRHLVAFVPTGVNAAGVDLPVIQDRREGHHAEDTFRILEPFGISGPPPAPRLARDARPPAPQGPLTIGMHVSARRPRNRWPEEAYVSLVRELHAHFDARFHLFWAPGADDDARHPGDDARSARIAAALTGLPVQPVPTRTVKGLIDALAACDVLVCSDGGAMHLAAALAKPIVCFFGDSPASEWHPLGVPYRLLQPPSLDAADIAVEEALAAFESLAAEAAFLRRPARRPLGVARPT
jgi:ADP-heptose:LPS heptosyltransferase